MVDVGRTVKLSKHEHENKKIVIIQEEFFFKDKYL